MVHRPAYTHAELLYPVLPQLTTMTMALAPDKLTSFRILAHTISQGAWWS